MSRDAEIINDGSSCEIRLTHSPRLQRFDTLLEAGSLPDAVLNLLLQPGADFLAVRQGPPVWPTTPGTCRLCVEFDLADRAVELLTAAGAVLEDRV